MLTVKTVLNELGEFKDMNKEVDNIVSNLLSNEKKLNNIKQILLESNPKPKIKYNYNNCIIVFGIPKIPKEKLEKMKMFINKMIFSKFGIADNIVNLEFELETAKNSKGEDVERTSGNFIVEFDNSEIAFLAANKLSNYKFDKDHVMTSFTFDELEFNEKQELKEEITCVSNFNEYKKNIENSQGFSQIYYLNDHGKLIIQDFNFITKNNELRYEIDTGFKGKAIQNTLTCSKKSLFFAVLFNDYVLLQTGNDYKDTYKLEHKGVKEILFSNFDNYLVTISQNSSSSDEDNVIIWNLLNMSKVKGFKINNKSVVLKNFGFSYDDNYFTAIFEINNKRKIFFYYLPFMEFVKCPFTNSLSDWAVEDPLSFSWCYEINKCLVVGADSKTGFSYIKIFEFVKDKNNETEVKVMNWRTTNFTIKDIIVQWSNPTTILLLMDIVDGKKREFLLQSAEIVKGSVNAITKNLEIKALDNYCFGYFNKFIIIIGKESLTDKKKTTFIYYIENNKIDLLEKYTDSKFDSCCFSKTSEVFCLFNKLNANLLVGFYDFNINKSKKITKNMIQLYSGKNDDYKNSTIKMDNFGNYMILINEMDERMRVIDFLGNDYSFEQNIKPKTIGWVNIDDTYLNSLTNIIKTPEITKNVINEYIKNDKKFINKEEFEIEEKNEQEKKIMKQYFENKQKDWNNLKEERINRLGYNEDIEWDDSEFTKIKLIDKEELLNKVEICLN